MTVEEAFILRQKSNFDDCANSVCGLLRSLAGRIDLKLTDDVQGNVAEHLLVLANRLRDNNELSGNEITMHFGENRRRELARQQIVDHVSPYQVWKDNVTETSPI